MLIIDAIGIARILANRFTRNVGIGSRLVDLDLAEHIKMYTSFKTRTRISYPWMRSNLMLKKNTQHRAGQAEHQNTVRDIKNSENPSGSLVS